MFSYSFQTLRLPAATSANRPGKWVALLGWFLTAGACTSLLVGLADVRNFAILLAAGAVFIPIGLLLVTSGRILGKLANIEKNTREATEFPPTKRPEEL